MSKSICFAALAAAAFVATVSPASACPQPCGMRAPIVEPHVYYYQEEIEPLKRPQHYIVERGPLYDGLGVFAPPRVFEPRRKYKNYPGVYGYGIGYSGGPVAKRYPYVSHKHRHRAAISVYY